MFMRAHLGLFLLAPLICAAAASAQQDALVTQPLSGEIYLEVVVTPKSGPPVTGLKQEDFTLLDNKLPQTITSFRALGRSQTPLEILIVVDAVNANFDSVAFERGEIEKFLRADGGHLAHPTTLAVFTDTGMQIQEGFSDDGNALATSLDQQIIGLRTIHRSAAFYGAVERFQLSLKALYQLAAREAARPGRKVILWVSPGWPLFSRSNIELDSKQRQEMFEDIVSFSTQLLKGRITLYSIDPLGSRDSGHCCFYESFLEGIREPSQVDYGDLALQVLATQSGGLALTGGNDVAALLHKCLADTDAYYELSFYPPSDARRDEYHHLEVKLTNSALTARTRQGYYAQADVKELRKVPIVESPTKPR